MIVLDADAVLAYLRDEHAAEAVGERIRRSRLCSASKGASSTLFRILPDNCRQLP